MSSMSQEYKFDDNISLYGATFIQFIIIFVCLGIFNIFGKLSYLIYVHFALLSCLMLPAWIGVIILFIKVCNSTYYLIKLIININRDNCKSIIVDYKESQLILKTSKNKQVLPVCNITKVIISCGRNSGILRHNFYGAIHGFLFMYLFHIKIVTNGGDIYRITLSKDNYSRNGVDDEGFLYDYANELLCQFKIPDSTETEIQVVAKEYNLSWHSE
jgi:hypothetical protein